MGIDADPLAILNDLVKFLESLADEINLPSNLENDRTNLLRRSKSSLAAAGQRTASPEPYLDMNAGKGKGLLHLVKSRDDITDENNHITEYIVADNPCNLKTQDDYECFQELSVQLPSDDNAKKEQIINIYRTFSTEQSKLMCQCQCKVKCKGRCHSNMNKCGTLFQKEERRLFGFQLFDQLRECWIGLIGHHLLIYTTKHDKQPIEVISIRGYSARPVTDMIARDPERNKSAFEIFCPGDKTYQFMSKHPKEMEQWIAVINRAGLSDVKKSYNSDTFPEFINNKLSMPNLNSSVSSTEEQYQDVHDDDILTVCVRNNSCAKELERNNHDDDDDVELKSRDPLNPSGQYNENNHTNDNINNNNNGNNSNSNNGNNSNAPPLPARIPRNGIPVRRLPSLPQEPAVSYDAMDDGYDESDIYHQIEDFKHPSVTYQNFKNPSEVKNHSNNNNTNNRKHLEVDTYDDVAENAKKKDKAKKKKLASKRNLRADTYDDIQGTDNHSVNHSHNLQSNNNKPEVQIHQPEERQSLMYDDIEAMSDNLKKDTKEPRKKSFLDRMRYKKDSSKKEKSKKMTTCKEITIQHGTYDANHQHHANHDQNEHLPTYDDIAELNSMGLGTSVIESMPEYTCPPPPRPIYVKPPTIDLKPKDDTIEEVYDDIEALRNEITSEKKEQNGLDANAIESSSANNANQHHQHQSGVMINSLTIPSESLMSSFLNTLRQSNIVENDVEHYQVPRPQEPPIDTSLGVGQLDVAPNAVDQEELYDDIAILADFRSRQREDSACSNSSATTEKTVITVTKAWNRFASGRKSKTNNELTSFGVSKNNSNNNYSNSRTINTDDDVDTSVESNDENETSKFKKIQRLIKKTNFH